MIRTAIIGAGGIAHKHAAAIARMPDVTAVGVLDPRPENARAIAELCGARVIRDLDEVLGEVDMIHLLTPPSKRTACAEAAMRAGKHVLCEKPLAVSLADAVRMQDLAAETGVLFMTAFNMRFRPGYRMLRDDVLSGRLGDVVSVWSHRVGPGSGFGAPLGDSWRTDPNLVCGMAIESLSHDIDMFRGLGLGIETVAARVQGVKPELPAFDNNAQVVLGLAGGRAGVINASWSSHLPSSSRGVVGLRGTAMIRGDGFFDFVEHRIRTDGMEHARSTWLNDLFDAESYYTENRHFADCVRDGVRPDVTADNGVEALRVSLAILESSRTGRTVRVAEIEP
ncbi:MAG: Gfo/Idh/MocA family oxidoreductase [Clostridia bacterium]|nr:Gfo/Idh/MocA family oxidoreductase [Clostridia bacterium]